MKDQNQNPSYAKITLVNKIIQATCTILSSLHFFIILPQNNSYKSLYIQRKWRTTLQKCKAKQHTGRDVLKTPQMHRLGCLCYGSYPVWSGSVLSQCFRLRLGSSESFERIMGYSNSKLPLKLQADRCCQTYKKCVKLKGRFWLIFVNRGASGE